MKKHNFNDLWKVQEGSKIFWQVQAEKGILSFKRKKDALKWQESINKSYKKGIIK